MRDSDGIADRTVWLTAGDSRIAAASTDLLAARKMRLVTRRVVSGADSVRGVRTRPARERCRTRRPAQAVPPGGRAALGAAHRWRRLPGVASLAGTLVAVAPDDQFPRQPTRSAALVAPALRRSHAGRTRCIGGFKALLARGAAQHDWVLVHDAARCLVTTAQIDQLMDAVRGRQRGGLLAHKLPDTLKTAVTGPSGVRVAATVDRS